MYTRWGCMIGRWLCLGGFSVCLGVSSLLHAELDEEEAAHWESSAYFLYMRRAQLHEQGIVVHSGSSQDRSRIAIHSKDLLHAFTYEPGYRVSLIYHPHPQTRFEGSFFVLNSWKGSKKAVASGDLSVPFASDRYSADFNQADRAHAFYSSSLWGAEGNYWNHEPFVKESSFGFSRIIGFRFFHWDEAFSIAMTHASTTSHYRIHTENRALGVQVGCDFRMHWRRNVDFDLLAKAGVLANSAEQDQFLGAFGDKLAVRHSQKQKWRAGVLADIAAHLSLQPLPFIVLRVGYEMLFLNGLALAPEQVSFRIDPQAGQAVKTTGHAVVHGLLGGIAMAF